MNTSILIHKNSYSKIHSAISYSIGSSVQNSRLINLHNQIYDLSLSLKPKTIILQFEEYSQEMHQFVHDKSLPSFNIIFTLDNFPSKYNQYLDIIKKIHQNHPIAFKIIVPIEFHDLLKSNDIHIEGIIPYDKVYNNYVFAHTESSRNDKILCILDQNPECIDFVKPYLYPNTTSKIILINNPKVEYDQNIGLAFDRDMSNLLNSYGSVLDLSNSYDAEISLCRIPKYKVETEWIKTEPKIIDTNITSIDNFIQHITEHLI